MRQAIVPLLLIGVVLYVGICGALYLLQERLLFFPERLPPEHHFSFPLPFREIAWDIDGVTLHALHFTVDHPTGVILFLHGNVGSVRSWGYAAAPLSSAATMC